MPHVHMDLLEVDDEEELVEKDDEEDEETAELPVVVAWDSAPFVLELAVVLLDMVMVLVVVELDGGGNWRELVELVVLEEEEELELVGLAVPK